LFAYCRVEKACYNGELALTGTSLVGFRI